MFARRPGQRMTRNRIQSDAQTSPMTILGNTVKQWQRADLDVTIGTGVSGWFDLSGNGNDFAQGTGSLQPAFEAAGFNGKPSILFDGVDDFLQNTTLAASLPGGNDTPFSWYCALQYVSNVPAVAVAYSCGNSAANPPTVSFSYTNTGNLWQVIKHDDAAGTATVSGGVRDTSRHIMEVHHTGTATDIVVDGIYIATAGPQDVGVTTLNRIFLGCNGFGSTKNAFANVRVAEQLLASANPNAAQLTGMRAYFSRYS